MLVSDEKRDVIADLNSERDVRGDVLQALVTITLLLAIFKVLLLLFIFTSVKRGRRGTRKLIVSC